MEDICRQRLCNNSLVTAAGRPVVNNTWIGKNFIKMKDIITEERTLLTEENINTKYDVRFKPLEYNSLGSAIPKKWKKILKNNHKDPHLTKPDLECEIQIDNIQKPINSVETKDLYRQLVTIKAKDRPVKTNGKKIRNLT